MIDRIIDFVLRQRLIQQVLKFGVVGTCAAIVHMSIVITGVTYGGYPPLVVNIFAFFTSFTISFNGHRRWTFSDVDTHTMTALPRFFFVGSTSFIINESLFYILLHFLHLYYSLALVIVLATVPPFNFIFSKAWAFKPHQRTTA